MPKLGNDHYDYTPKGIAAYRRAKKKRLKEDFGTSFIAGAGAYAGTELAKAAHEKYKAARKKRAAVKAAKNEVYERTFGLLEQGTHAQIGAGPTLSQAGRAQFRVARKEGRPVSPRHTGAGHFATRRKSTGSTLDKIQTGLDVAGAWPAVGAVADVPNALISGMRGNLGDAGVRAAQAIPVFGQGVLAAKVGSRANRLRKSADAVSDTAEGLRKVPDAPKVVSKSDDFSYMSGKKPSKLELVKDAPKPKAHTFDPPKIDIPAAGGRPGVGTALAGAGAATAAGVVIKTAADQESDKPQGTPSGPSKIDAPSDKSSDIGATKPSADPAPASPMRMSQRPHVTSVADAPQLGHTGGKGHTMTSTTPGKVTSAADNPKLQVRPASKVYPTNRPVQAPEGDMGTPEEFPDPAKQPRIAPGPSTNPWQIPHPTEPAIEPAIEPARQPARQPRIAPGKNPRQIPMPDDEVGVEPAGKLSGSKAAKAAPRSRLRPVQMPDDEITTTSGKGGGKKGKGDEGQKKDEKPKSKWKRKLVKGGAFLALAALGGGGGGQSGAGGSGFTRRKKTRFPHPSDLEGGPGPVGRRSSSSSTKSSSRSSSSKRRLAAHTIYPKMAKLLS